MVKVMGLRTRRLAGPIMDSWSASPADVLRQLGTAERAAGQPNAVAERLAAQQPLRPMILTHDSASS